MPPAHGGMAPAPPVAALAWNQTVAERLVHHRQPRAPAPVVVLPTACACSSPARPHEHRRARSPHRPSERPHASPEAVPAYYRSAAPYMRRPRTGSMQLAPHGHAAKHGRPTGHLHGCAATHDVVRPHAIARSRTREAQQSPLCALEATTSPRAPHHVGCASVPARRLHASSPSLHAGAPSITATQCGARFSAR